MHCSDGHSRIVLSKALTSAHPVRLSGIWKVYKNLQCLQDIRLYATNHLGELIRTSSQANAWMMRLLLTQLYDPDLNIQELAVRHLEEACESPDILEMVVEMHPTIDHLGDIGHELLLK